MKNFHFQLIARKTYLQRCYSHYIQTLRYISRPGNIWKETVDEDTNDLHLKLSDAMDRSKWMKMNGENFSDINNDSDAVS